MSHVQIEIYELMVVSCREVWRMPGSAGVGDDGGAPAVVGAVVAVALSASATLCVAASGSMGLMAGRSHQKLSEIDRMRRRS
jgi:hypothetical protein